MRICHACSEEEELTFFSVFNQAVAHVVQTLGVRSLQFHDYHGGQLMHCMVGASCDARPEVKACTSCVLRRASCECSGEATTCSCLLTTTMHHSCLSSTPQRRRAEHCVPAAPDPRARHAGGAQCRLQRVVARLDRGAHHCIPSVTTLCENTVACARHCMSRLGVGLYLWLPHPAALCHAMQSREAWVFSMFNLPVNQHTRT